MLCHLKLFNDKFLSSGQQPPQSLTRQLPLLGRNDGPEPTNGLTQTQHIEAVAIRFGPSLKFQIVLWPVERSRYFDYSSLPTYFYVWVAGLTLHFKICSWFEIF